MIPAGFITFWAQRAPWPSQDQVEQDLVLSRLLCEIAAHPLLGSELVFRGGTCLHKVHLPKALRYSEDLDYVRATHGPIGPLFDALREIASTVGMDAATDVAQFPKFFFRSSFESGSGRMQIKVEINTYETSPARPHIRLRHEVKSRWWSGTAEVLTFEPAELVATKLRALYQRRKGRDLFDLWLRSPRWASNRTASSPASAPTGPTDTRPQRRQPTSKPTLPTRVSAATCSTSSTRRPSSMSTKPQPSSRRTPRPAR